MVVKKGSFVTAQEQHLQNLVNFTQVFERADSTLAGRPIKTGIATSVPSVFQDAPAWSDGEKIYFNINQVGDVTDTNNIVALLGVNYHELSHILWSPRMNSSWINQIMSRDLTAAWNMLEDQRIETLMTARYGATKSFLTSTFLKHCLNADGVDFDTLHLITWGRRYLGDEVRNTLADRFNPKFLDESIRIIDEYRLIPNVQATHRSMKLVEEFHQLMLDMAEDSGESPPDPNCMSAQNQQKNQPDQESAEKAADKAQKEAEQEQKRPSKSEESDDGKSGKSKGSKKNNSRDDDASDGESEANGEEDEDQDSPEDGDGEDDAQSSADDGDEGDSESDDDADGEGSDGESDSEDSDDDESDEGSEGDGSDGEDSDDSEGDSEGDGEGDGDGDDSSSGSGSSNGGQASNGSGSTGGMADSVGGPGPAGDGGGIPSVPTDDEIMDAMEGALDAAAPEALSHASGVRNSIVAPSNERIPPVLVPKMHTRQAKIDPEMYATMRQVSTEFQKIVADADPGWKTHNSAGRVNMKRAMAGDGYDTVFDQWNEGNQLASDMEVVILVDISYSMSSQIEQTAKALWVTEAAIESVGHSSRVSVFAFNDDGLLISDGLERSERTHYKRFSVAGGTNPFDALREARRIFQQSKKAHKILVVLTDGDWDMDEDADPDEAIKILNNGGVITSLLFLLEPPERRNMYSVSEQKIAANPQRWLHGVQVSRVATSPGEIIKFAKDIVTLAMMSK